MGKKYFKGSSEIRSLAIGYGSCMATVRITVDGELVGYMYKEQPNTEIDSGWRFFTGDESSEYVNDPKNIEIYDINTIANYDPTITPFLDAPVGAAYIKKGSTFVVDG